MEMTRPSPNTTRPRSTRGRELAAVTADLPQESFTAVGAADPGARDRGATHAQHAGAELADLGRDNRVADHRRHRPTSAARIRAPILAATHSRYRPSGLSRFTSSTHNATRAAHSFLIPLPMSTVHPTSNSAASTTRAITAPPARRRWRRR